MKQAPKWNRSLRDDVDDLERALAAACEQRARCHLEMVDPRGETRRFELLDATCLVGSGPEAHVRLHDPQIAPVHVAIVQRQDSFWAVDHVIPEAANVSWSQTTLNNQPIPPEGTKLEDGDLLDIGPARITFRAEPVARVTQALERVVFSPPARKPRPTPTPNTPAVPAVSSLETQHGYVPGYEIPADASPASGRVHRVYDATPAAAVEGAKEDPLHDILSKVHMGLSFLKRYRWTLVAGAVLGIAAGVASIKVKPPPASAVVAFTLVAEASENPVDPRRRTNLEFFASAQRNFASLEQVRQTLEDLGEEASDDRAGDIAKRIKLTPLGPETYQAAYADVRPPEEVEQFLDRHLALYLETEIAKTIRVISRDVDFLREKLAEAESDLDASRKAMVDFKEQHVQGLPTQAGAHYSSLLEIRERERELRSELGRVRLELGHHRGKLKSDAAVRDSRSAAASQYRTRLLGLEQDLAKARGMNKGDEHPDVLALKSEKREVERQIRTVMEQGDAVTDTSAGRSYRAIKDTVAGLQTSEKMVRSELGSLASERKRLEGIVDDLPDLEARYRELERENQLNELNYDRIYQNLQTSELQLDLETGRAAARHEIVAPTTAYVDSETTTMVKRGLVGAVVGFILGLALGIARMFMGRAKHVWQTAIVKTSAS